MILINLLPHREAARRQRAQAFFIGLGVSAMVGVLLAGLWYGLLVELTAVQQARNGFLQAEIKILEAQIKDIATLRSDIEALKARQKAVEDLQTDRNTPVRLLGELVALTPEGVYLSSIKQLGDQITLAGVASTNERVSEFLRNASYNAKWLEQPELVEIKAANAVSTTGTRDPRRLFEFSMRLSLKRQPAPAGLEPAPAKKAG